jgi:hypothetical protein
MQKSDFAVVMHALDKTYQLGSIKVEVLKKVRLKAPKASLSQSVGPQGQEKLHYSTF